MTENLWDKIFANAVKVAISTMQSLTQEKNSQIKLLLMRAGGKIGENLLPVKVSSSTVLLYRY